MNFNDLTVKLHLPGDSERDCGAVVLSKRPAADSSNRDSQVCDKSLSCAPAVSALEKATTTLEDGNSGCLELMAAEIPEKEPKDENINKIERSMPATGIGWRTTNILSQYLRPPRPGSCDWRDMAEEMGFSYQLHIQNFALESDPVAKVLSAWCTKPGSNVGKLLDIIEKIERHDVLHELPAFLEEDCKRWKRTQAEARDPIQVPEVTGNFASSTSDELRGITLNDSPSGPPEMFDAYVCFAMADLEFVQQLRSQLESKPHNYKLCIDQRDLLPGGSHALVTAEIIKNRCNKMLVILSPEFLQSPSCDFQTKFAVSLEPGARKRRIIPILVKPCERPLIIQHINLCDFTKQDIRPWFWGRLRKAMSIR
ncbi:myeloid differentiation primary response protein MyD88 [Strongylocentrotus purpuratus]|uniref:Myeloid differentiation primary response protein MyD88 n=1 Tax=Strongylocentrotus purpuratus TaxID=7668 RepID=A0A7M7PU22_STRPU|nr:myeloid differentiation primary response protein MyD88 [Strongylocentrotus purpuratus]